MSKSDPSKKNQIAIIGAGFAGLAAAYRLYQHGYENFDVYEARNRVGGRVLSAHLFGPQGEITIELGGQNITDGGQAPFLRSLAKELGLSLLEEEVELKPTFYDDQTRHFTNLLELQRELFPFGKRQELKAKIQELAAHSQTIEDILINLFPDKGILYRSIAFKFAGYEGGMPCQVSAEAWEDLYYMLNGGVAAAHTSNIIETARIKGGNGRLALEITKQIEKHIHLSHPLKAIHLLSDERILLSFEGDVQKVYDQVILAIPCSVYKNIEIDQRLIPDTQLSFIRKIPYSNHAKVLLPTKADLPPYNQILTDEMVAFFSKESGIWMFYIYGPKGYSLKSLMRTKHKKALEMINLAYPTHLLPVHFPQEANDQLQFGTYDHVVTYFWGDDPYAQGSYSYRSPDIMSELKRIETYKGEAIRAPYAPINNRIFFAGEHTAIDAYFGTLEGAIESGERAARMILSQ